MGIKAAVTRVACNTSTGNQTITTTKLGGLTPKAAYFTVSRAVTDGVAADHAVLVVGAVTGASNRWSVWHSDEHAQAVSDSYSGFSTSLVLQIPNPTDGTVDGAADFSAWVTNGITVNWTDAPAAAYLVTVVFFAGTDLSAYAGNQAMGNTVNTAHDITTVGFQPHVVLGAMSTDVGGMSLGMVSDVNNTRVQVAVSSISRTGQATMAGATMHRNDCGIFELSNQGGTVWIGSHTAFDSQGFSVTTQTAGGQNRTYCYLALAFNGVAQYWAGRLTTPLATGNVAETGPAFTPQLVMLIPNLTESTGTAYTDTKAYSWGVAAFDSTNAYSTVATIADGAADSDTQSLSDDRAGVVPDSTGALDIEASFVSFDAAGFTLNYTNVAATAKRWPALALEEGLATAYTLTANAGSYTLTGTAATLKAARTVVAATTAFALSGTSATLKRGLALAASAGTYTLTGVPAALKATRVLYAASGFSMAPTGLLLALSTVSTQTNFTLAGAAASLEVGRSLAASAGSYTLTGTVASLRVSRVLSASSGSYSVAGIATTTRLTRILAATGGSYAFTGIEAGLLYESVGSYVISSEPGVHVLSGTSATLRATRLLHSASGARAITGTSAALLVGRRITASAGTYALTGLSAPLYFGGRLIAAQGSYTLTGTAAGQFITHVLMALAGSYAMTGRPATLTHAAVPDPVTPATNIYAVPAENRIYAVTH